MKVTPDFTGERYIPGVGGFQIAYEHLHRYLLALPLAEGKDVLDVASGSGYGSALLARAARTVVAVEIDADTLRTARESNNAENLQFVQGDALNLPLGDGTVDLVVAMEVLEHVEDAERLAAEMARVVRPDGLVMVSTPNKAEYSDARDYSNKFHVREFYREEFLALMMRHFRHVELGYQRVRAGSLIIWEREDIQRREVFTAPLPEPAGVPPDAMYFIVLCSDSSQITKVLQESAYIDVTDGLIEEWSSQRKEANREIELLGKWGRELESRVEELHAALEAINGVVHERDQTIRSLQEELTVEIGKRDRLLVSLQQEFEERTQWAKDLEQTVKARDAEIERVNSELAAVGARLARIRHALLYRVLCRIGILPP